MEEKLIFIEPLLESAEAYTRTTYDLFKLKALDKATSVASAFVSRGISVLVLSMFTVMANIAIALWLGDLLGKSYYGFFCVAIFYLIVGGVLYFFMHNWIKKRVSQSIILQILN